MANPTNNHSEGKAPVPAQCGEVPLSDQPLDDLILSATSDTFRRTFACLLRKAGVDCLTIKDLGRWESLEMVRRYER